MASWDEELCTAVVTGNIKDVELSLKNGANLENTSNGESIPSVFEGTIDLQIHSNNDEGGRPVAEDQDMPPDIDDEYLTEVSSVEKSRICEKKGYLTEEEKKQAKVSNERRIKSEAMKQITKQLTRLRELELEPVSFMFLVKDEMTRVRRSRPRYIGKGVLYHKFKNVQSLLTKEELARAKTLENYYPSRNDVRQDVPMITPSKLHFGPGHSKQLAETQKKALEGTTTSLDTSETFTISVDSPLQNIRNRTKKQNAQKAPKETSRRKKANGKLKTALIQKESSSEEIQFSNKELQTTIQINDGSTDTDEIEGVVPFDKNREQTEDESANLTPYELFRHENIKDNEQFLQNLNFVNTLKKTQKPRKTNVSRKKTTVKINTTFAVLQPGLDLHEDNDENEEKRNTEIDVPCVNPATSIADVLDQNVWIAVAFEDTWYPGLVDSIEPDGLLVNFMHPCLLEKNKFQWPKKVDTMKVEKKFVLFVCLPPTRFQRGEKFYFEGYELILKLYLDFKKTYF